MKIGAVIGNVILGLIAVVLLGPTVVGIADVSWWFYTNHTLSGIEWTEGRVWLTVLSPLLTGMLVAVLTT